MSAFLSSLIELAIKGIPEGLLDVLAIYIFTKTPFEKKKFLFVCAPFIIAVYIIRWLPINYGVNTMLNLLVLIILFVAVNKTEISRVIISVIAVTVLLFLSEELNILLLTTVYGTSKTAELLTSTLGKTLYGIPSTIFYGIGIYISYSIIKKRDTKKKNKNKVE
jgi:hypothetical protein